MTARAFLTSAGLLALVTAIAGCAGPVAGRASVDGPRDGDKDKIIASFDGGAELRDWSGGEAAARRIYREILKQYPDAQEIRERLRSM